MNIVIVTYAISPYKGSEFAVAWNHISLMSPEASSHLQKTILYSSRMWGGYNNDIHKWEKKQSLANVRFIDCHRKSWLYECLTFAKSVPFLKQIAGLLLVDLDKRSIRNHLHDLCAKESVDVVHILNPIGFLTLLFNWRMPRTIPFIWGPIQAAEPGPWFLVKHLLLCHRKYSFFANWMIRKIFHAWLFRSSRRLQGMLKNSAMVFAATPRTQELLWMQHKKQASFLPENFILHQERKEPIKLRMGEPLRILFCGGLDTRKNLWLLLDALAQIKEQPWLLSVVGSGDAEEFKKDIAKYGFSEKVQWIGYIPRDTLQELFLQQHLLAITSIREGTPTVLWEAMSKAVPVLTLDQCGMSGVLSNSNSIKIDISSGNYTKVVQAIGREIMSCIEHPDRIQALSQGMIEVAKKYDRGTRETFWYGVYKDAFERKSL